MASLENTHHYCAFQKHANSEDNFRSQLTIAFFAAVNLLYGPLRNKILLQRVQKVIVCGL